MKIVMLMKRYYTGLFVIFNKDIILSEFLIDVKTDFKSNS